MSPASARAGQDRSRWQAFAICLAVSALTILDISKVNVGLPSIRQSMEAGPLALQLITAGYALTYALALIPAGRLGDLHSRRTMLLIGVGAFTITSGLCAVAPNLEFLVAARLLQGVAAGIQMPQTIGLIQQIFTGAERGRAFGYFGASVGIAAAIGPTVGGLLIHLGGNADGWRWLFWMNVPVGLVAFALAYRLLPKRPVRTEPEARSLDLVGSLLLSCATFGAMLPFALSTGDPSDTPLRWLWLVFAIVAAIGFVFWELDFRRRGRSPIVDFALFRHRSFRSGLVTATGYYAAMPATFLATTIYLQDGIGLSPILAGLASVPFALMSALASWVTGHHVLRRGHAIVTAGLLCTAVAFALLMLISADGENRHTPWLIAAALALAGVGSGCVTAANQTLTLEHVPVADAGVAGSLSQVGQRMGTAMGISIASSVFFAAIAAGRATANVQDVYAHAYFSALLVTIAVILVSALLSVENLVPDWRRSPDPS